MIAHQGEILFEGYGYERTKDMRLTSWSMAKSVTSLLLGICLDKELIQSYDDPAKKYVPELNGTLHGEVTLRNLTNMCSGASINHDRDNNKIYPSAINGSNTSIKRTVVEWNFRAEEQGVRYNYNNNYNNNKHDNNNEHNHRANTPSTAPLTTRARTITTIPTTRTTIKQPHHQHQRQNQEQ